MTENQRAAAPAIEFENVACTFETPQGLYTATEHASFSVSDGEFVSVVGPTGCGKSTLLNMAAGLLRPSEGCVRIFGEPLAGLNRRAGYMFQAESLMPWATALENVAIGLRYRGVAKDEAEARAMAQTLVANPDILLMDESFSALDVQTRELMENELLAIWQAERKAVLFITHDLDEAVSLSDRVVVLSAGPASHPIGDFPIPLERPRNVAEIRMRADYLECRSAIWSVLRDEVLKSYEAHRSALAA